jgi:predicted aspartyl protease
MEKELMGKVITAAKLENVYDVYEAKENHIAPDRVRKLEVADALVDTGATYLAMPKTMIDQLGLRRFGTRHGRTASGSATFEMYGLVRLTVLDRFCHVEVSEIAEGCPVLIGQLPLEALDFVVDPKRQRLIGNPDHGGQHMIDMF